MSLNREIFETVFRLKERAAVVDVRWKRLPELGSGVTTESSVPHGAETGGYNEGEGGGKPEAARGGGNADEIRKVGGGDKVVIGLKSVQENFTVEAEFQRDQWSYSMIM